MTEIYILEPKRNLILVNIRELSKVSSTGKSTLYISST